MLIQLIYTSTAHRDLSHEELIEILESSVRNNQQRNITGLLLYNKGTFLQMLEGAASHVDEIFERIKRDSRHRNIEALLRTSTRKREFSNWHMGFRAMRKSDAAALPNYAPFFEDGFDSTLLTASPQESLSIMKAIAGLPD